MRVTAIGECLELQPTGMSYRGTAVARHNGRVVFVSGALPGEEVVAEVEREQRDFLEARTVGVLVPSPQRVEARCSHFASAGSCEWEFIAYAEQVRLKHEILRDQFRRVGHFADAPLLDPIRSTQEWGYRNHARFVIDAAGNPCYLRRGTHVPVPIEFCAVLQPWMNEVLPQLQGRLRGLAGVELRYGVNTGETLITPSLEGRGVALPSGQPDYHEELLGRRFRVSAGSFFQVNTGVAGELARLLIEELQLDGTERVADLYAGVGAFACLLSPHAGAVVAVEAAPEAIDDGRLNSGFLENVRYRKGTVANVLPQLSPPPEVVVLDPPRSGCERGVITTLLAQSPRRIAYVSCDPATLARDARLLVDGGYALRSLRMIDMFPQTYHVESLALFGRDP
jgi:23S rRNA (uracil1939-C5)-methyltransferase